MSTEDKNINKVREMLFNEKFCSLLKIAPPYVRNIIYEDTCTDEDLQTYDGSYLREVLVEYTEKARNLY